MLREQKDARLAFDDSLQGKEWCLKEKWCLMEIIDLNPDCS